MHRDAVLSGLPESFMAPRDEQDRCTGSRRLAAARGILVGLGIAVLMWALLIAGAAQIFR
jgi:hypothetical protein